MNFALSNQGRYMYYENEKEQTLNTYLLLFTSGQTYIETYSRKKKLTPDKKGKL